MERVAMAVSFPHEGFIELVRNRPDLVADLLTRNLHIEVPRFTRAQLLEPTLHEIAPIEHFADALVLLTAKDQPVLGVVVEAQLRRDDRKHYTWPQYAMNARARHRCPCIVAVVTTSPRVAHWASQPIDVGNGTVFRQHIIGPGSIPKLTDPERAAREPELAVLSAMAHGRRNTPAARRIAVAAFAGLSRLPDDDQRLLYSLLVERSLGAALRKALEMQADIRKYMSASQQRSYDKARTEGKAEGKAEAVLTILAQRGLPMTVRQRHKIRQCTDLATLDRWLDRALSVTSVDELLG
ncbi:MAG TPA: hypothetical protein VF469_28945 [Kofleriaceae bacterium]